MGKLVIALTISSNPIALSNISCIRLEHIYEGEIILRILDDAYFQICDTMLLLWT